MQEAKSGPPGLTDLALVRGSGVVCACEGEPAGVWLPTGAGPAQELASPLRSNRILSPERALAPHPVCRASHSLAALMLSLSLRGRAARSETGSADQRGQLLEVAHAQLPH
jgi:hypothetical protein